MQTAYKTGLPVARGEDAGCIVIAEVAQAHDGSLGTAHAYLDAAWRAGADAVKFQTHIASAESSAKERWRVQFSPQDRTRLDYWRRMEFTEEQWAGLKQHAEERGLLFLSSPFSVEAAEMLVRLGIRAWKIASGEVGNAFLLRRIVETRLPVVLSTGMSRLEETDHTVATLQNAGIPVSVLQCTSAYPCPPERVGLNMLAFYRERYRCPVGLSDHSGTIFAGLGAAALGAQLIEVHITFSRECFGPDVPASLTIEELKTLVDGVRFLEAARRNPVEKEALAPELDAMRQLFTQSLVFRTDLATGLVLQEEHLTGRKPGDGIPIEALPRVIGRRLSRDARQGSFVSEDDLEPVRQ